jgi:hypothetical protein
MMEAVSTYETSVNFYQTARRNIRDDSHLNPILVSAETLVVTPVASHFRARAIVATRHSWEKDEMESL